jgi:hypothetical protein
MVRWWFQGCRNIRRCCVLVIVGWRFLGACGNGFVCRSRERGRRGWGGGMDRWSRPAHSNSCHVLWLLVISCREMNVSITGVCALRAYSTFQKMALSAQEDEE